MDVTLSDPQWISLYHAHHRYVSEFRKGRSCLAGDAAHVHSPAGAQGMNTGLQGSYNLAWKLALVLRGQANEAILRYVPGGTFTVFGRVLSRRREIPLFVDKHIDLLVAVG